MHFNPRPTIWALAIAHQAFQDSIPGLIGREGCEPCPDLAASCNPEYVGFTGVLQ